MKNRVEEQTFEMDSVTYRKITNTETGAVCYHKQSEESYISLPISKTEYCNREAEAKAKAGSELCLS